MKVDINDISIIDIQIIRYNECLNGAIDDFHVYFRYVKVHIVCTMKILNIVFIRTLKKGWETAD